ncbi:TIM barrel protein [Isoptericola sp. AK164]|uniref:TIM barrel protein n=1 Tax=Isoptericola sp. AK164 TaxID=3024246 RepID=UPI0024183EBD|nr:TIM barrel protein [Isoptericola sp. AK164]
MDDEAQDAGGRTLAVNCSLLMKDLPVAERLERVRDAGATAVEFWWPFPTADPDPVEVDAFATAIETSGLDLVGLNLFAGDMAGGDRGVLSWPGREDELRASAEVARILGRRLGVRRFNTLYGNRSDAFDPAVQDAHADRMLREIAPVLGQDGGIAMIEPVSGAEAYPVRTAADAAAVVARARGSAGPTNVGILLDLYHLAVNGDDVVAAIERFGADAAHVQLADAPGRGAPGTGDLPLVDWVRRLRDVGYTGHVALEYADTSHDPLSLVDLDAWKDLA